MKKILLAAGGLFWATAAFSQSAPKVTGLNKPILNKVLAGWSQNESAVQNGTSFDGYGKGVFLSGNDALDKATAFLNGTLADAGLRPDEWTVTRNVATGKFSYVDFSQKIAGREVKFSNLSFQFRTDGSLVRLKVAAFEAPESPVLRSTAAVAEAGKSDLEGQERVDGVRVSPDWVWFPVRLPASKMMTLTAAYPVEADGLSEDGQTPGIFEGWIDAQTGKLLFRHNVVKAELKLKIKGQAFGATPFTPLDTVGFPNMRVQVGNSTNYLYTDAQGFVAGPAVTLPASLTLPLQGKWSKVNVGGTTPSVTITVTDTGSTYMRTELTRYQNAYYHVNKVHDYVKFRLPSFTGMDFVLPTNIDLTTGTCNAFYNGTSINFYAASPGCPSLAEYADVIYHEYGHGINRTFYNANGRGSMYNGALNEGYADVWSFLITKNPVLGQGATSPGGVIRRYDLAPKVVPVDIAGQVHADGELIAGSWWDVGQNMGSIDSMGALFAETFYSLEDGLQGNEPAVYKSILIAALLADDNDNNPGNGSPNYNSIVKGFARHGIYLGAYATLLHTEPSVRPGNEPVTIVAEIASSYSGMIGKVQLLYRTRSFSPSPYDTVLMTPNGVGIQYTAQIPGVANGNVIDYAIRIQNAMEPADVTYYPEGYRPELPISQVTLNYQYGVGLKVMQAEDFETSSGAWTLGLPTDNATSGQWTWGQPTATYQSGGPFTPLITQPGGDHTTGTGKALYTGQFSEVANGNTSLLSPILDITGYTTPVAEYYRWYSNDRGANSRNDLWRVELSDLDFPVPYLVDNTRQSDYNWRRRLVRLRDYVGPVATRAQFKFTAVDGGQQNTLEAAIDDFILYDAGDVAGVADVKAIRASVFPNPAHQVINVKLGSTKDAGMLSLYDLQGRLLTQQEIAAGTADYTVNTATLPAGTYFLMVKTGKVQQLFPITVAH